jgi:hypothetical protein
VTAHMDQCTRVYTSTGAVAHLLDPAHSPSNHRDEALCGLLPDPDGWFGTGSQDEHDTAAALLSCRRCANLAAGRG